MNVDPVTPSNFRGATIRRTGGFAGLNEEIRIHEDLRATVSCPCHGERTVALDQATAQELLHAFTRVAKERPEPSKAKGCDFMNYDIEMSWNGSTFRVASADVGADDALHGVMYAANRIVNLSKPGERAETELHIAAPSGGAARKPLDETWPPPFGNSGIVPAELQQAEGNEDIWRPEPVAH